ncbi:hypothetical protein B484DRAFT_444048 [Ochromonadaceae sp. CCMP2298]|nr:hypothetical protein B484DRAFT_444048 [Ochromonadaceae sp. CCMP2298]
MHTDRHSRESAHSMHRTHSRYSLADLQSASKQMKEGREGGSGGSRGEAKAQEANEANDAKSYANGVKDAKFVKSEEDAKFAAAVALLDGDGDSPWSISGGMEGVGRGNLGIQEQAHSQEQAQGQAHRRSVFNPSDAHLDAPHLVDPIAALLARDRDRRDKGGREKDKDGDRSRERSRSRGRDRDRSRDRSRDRNRDRDRSRQSSRQRSSDRSRHRSRDRDRSRDRRDRSRDSDAQRPRLRGRPHPSPAKWYPAGAYVSHTDAKEAISRLQITVARSSSESAEAVAGKFRVQRDLARGQWVVECNDARCRNEIKGAQAQGQGQAGAGDKVKYRSIVRAVGAAAKLGAGGRARAGGAGAGAGAGAEVRVRGEKKGGKSQKGKYHRKRDVAVDSNRLRRMSESGSDREGKGERREGGREKEGRDPGADVVRQPKSSTRFPPIKK